LIGDDGLSKVRRKTLAPDEELTPVAESIHELALNFCTFPALCIKRTKGAGRAGEGKAGVGARAVGALGALLGLVVVTCIFDGVSASVGQAKVENSHFWPVIQNGLKRRSYVIKPMPDDMSPIEGVFPFQCDGNGSGLFCAAQDPIDSFLRLAPSGDCTTVLPGFIRVDGTEIHPKLVVKRVTISFEHVVDGSMVDASEYLDGSAVDRPIFLILISRRPSSYGIWWRHDR
jgi:hypothetical protein